MAGKANGSNGAKQIHGDEGTLALMPNTLLDVAGKPVKLIDCLRQIAPRCNPPVPTAGEGWRQSVALYAISAFLELIILQDKREVEQTEARKAKAEAKR